MIDKIIELREIYMFNWCSELLMDMDSKSRVDCHVLN